MTAPEQPPVKPPERPVPAWRAALRRWLRWMVRRVPPGARSLVGLALIVGGTFGFLPVLGFWMIPLGLAAIALDLRPIRRALRRRRLARARRARRG